MQIAPQLMVGVTAWYRIAARTRILLLPNPGQNDPLPATQACHAQQVEPALFPMGIRMGAMATMGGRAMVE